MLDSVLIECHDMPPEVARAPRGAAWSGPAIGAAAVLFFVVSLVVCSVFGMFGGLFGALMFRKNAPPPPPPPVPTLTPPDLHAAAAVAATASRR